MDGWMDGVDRCLLLSRLLSDFLSFSFEQRRGRLDLWVISPGLAVSDLACLIALIAATLRVCVLHLRAVESDCDCKVTLICSVPRVGLIDCLSA